MLQIKQTHFVITDFYSSFVFTFIQLPETVSPVFVVVA